MLCSTRIRAAARHWAVTLSLTLSFVFAAACGSGGSSPGADVVERDASGAPADGVGGASDASAAADVSPATDALVDVASDGTTDGGHDAAADTPQDTGAADVASDTVDAVVPDGPAVCFSPRSVDFGELPAGQRAELQLALTRCGAAGELQLTGVSLDPRGSADFGLGGVPELPMAFAAGDELWIDVSYQPSGGDWDEGAVIATWITEGQGGEVRLPLAGAEPGANVPLLAVEPSPVALGDVRAGDDVSRSVALRNVGGAAIHLLAVSLEDARVDGLTLDEAPAPGSQLLSGESLEIGLRLVVASPFSGEEPIAALRIESNDDREPVLLVPVTARYAAPHLNIEPSPVSLGAVPQDDWRSAEVTLHNAGGLPLNVDGVMVRTDDTTWGNEFTLLRAPELEASPDGGAQLGVLAPGASADLAVRFTNLGPERGDASGTLVVWSDDPRGRSLEAALAAQRAPAADIPEGGVALEPLFVDFGAVRTGGALQRTVALRNVAGAEREVLAVGARACTLAAGADRPTCAPDEDSAWFTLTPTQPLPVTLAVGEALELTAHYQPPEHDSVLAHFALLQAEVREPGLGPDEAASLTPPLEGGHNLRGEVGLPLATTVPETLDFGDVPVGCTTPSRSLVVVSRNAVPLLVSDVYLDGCGVDVLPVDLPDTDSGPLLAPVEISLAFVPLADGLSSCELVVETDDPERSVLRIDVLGAGAGEQAVHQEFVHNTAPDVDVLFVVDDSGSMCGEQDRLAANLAAFVERAEQWGNAFRLGVVSTCVHSEHTCGGVGHLRAPDGVDGRWVDDASWETFSGFVDLGCEGRSDPQEAGLEAARAALGEAILELTEVPCVDDDGCAGDRVCLPDLGLCGGANGGFRRPDAAMEIIVLSDEDDQSPDALASYQRYFREYATGSGKGARVHAIVGDPETGCANWRNGSTAMPGDRYAAVAAVTDGLVASICDDSFADALDAMGDLAFRTRWAYSLTHEPAPESIRVARNGVPCSEGWTYEEADNAVRFHPTGACAPTDGDRLTVDYERPCL